MSLSDQDRARIAAAIGAAEAKTSGEIVCVLARRSTDSSGFPVLLAAILALALPWALVAWTQWPVRQILLAQIVCFVVALFVLSLPPLRTAFVPRAAQRAHAHRLAMEQFVARGLGRKKDRTAILIFVSLAEHYARIIADEGMNPKIARQEWQQAVDALTDKMRGGQIADGFVAAIEHCGQVLEGHFPENGTRDNELADRIYVI